MYTGVMDNQKDFLPAAGHDLFLPFYDPLLRWMGGGQSRTDLIEQAQVQPGHHILDIGCGTGTLAVQLKRQYRTAEVFGFDPDRKALRRAKTKAQRAAVSVKFEQGFADELPYERGSFDRVFSSFMLHHLDEPDRKKTLSEVLRVLKPGGSLHLLDFTAGHPGSNGLWRRLINAHAQLKDNSDERILQLMSRAGFTQVEKVKAGSMFFGLLPTAYYKATA